MYTLSVKRDFIARHYLIGGDWGPENFPNSHHRGVERANVDRRDRLNTIFGVEQDGGRPARPARAVRRARRCSPASIRPSTG